MGEFDLIKRYFSHHKGLNRPDILQTVGDDCAITTIPAGHQLAITTDTLVSGTHFLPDINPIDLAYKSLAVNLSDLAAMGATPKWISLALTLPEIDHQWLNLFSQSFFQTLDRYQVALIGGDTTKGPLSLTLTAQGFIPTGKGLFRHKAQVGDLIFVSGTLGDSAAGLSLLLNHTASSKADDYLLERHLRPTPRIELGQLLSAFSQCAIDISDGLLADLGHILERSQCGARLDVEKLPLSHELLNSFNEYEAEYFALCGGEDYELCFTVPKQHYTAVQTLAESLNTPCRCIGEIIAEPQLILLKHQQPYTLPDRAGFDHFG